MDGDTFLESLDSRKILDPSCRGSHLLAVDAAWTGRVPTWLERWQELLRLDQRDRWSGDSHRKRSGEILGHVEDLFFFFSSSPMWKQHSVKRKTGGDRTQRRHEGQVSYPPPDLKGKQNPSGREEERKDVILVLQPRTFPSECSCVPREHIRRKDRTSVLDERKDIKRHNQAEGFSWIPLRVDMETQKPSRKLEAWSRVRRTTVSTVKG